MNRAAWKQRAARLRASLFEAWRDTRGKSLVEYLIVIGACALLGIVGFTRYARVVKSDLAANARHIEGEGLPSTEGILSLVGADYNEVPGWCVKPNYCFAAGTPVQTESGDRAIESIVRGDRVWARDVSSGAIALRTVVNTYRTANVPVVDLELHSGLATREQLTVTPGHRFWVEGAGWLRADSLAERSLWSTEAPFTANIDGFESAPTTVYNLEVAEFHTYFVGHAHVLVHNGDPASSDCGTDSTGETPTKNPYRVECGESGTYGSDLNGDFKGDDYRPTGKKIQRDHIPSGGALKARADKILDDLVKEQMKARCRYLTPTARKKLDEQVKNMKAVAEKALNTAINNDGYAIAMPTELHNEGRTYGNKNKDLIAQDSQELQLAAQADIEAYEELLGIGTDEHGNPRKPTYKGPMPAGCKEQIVAALERARNKTDAQYQAEMEQFANQQMQQAGLTTLIKDSCPPVEQAQN